MQDTKIKDSTRLAATWISGVGLEARDEAQVLSDARWTAIDGVNRQASLNGARARIDSDGRLRAVISLTDPGVLELAGSGWLSRGCHHGSLDAQQRCPNTQLDRVPADTAYITPAERERCARQRRWSAQRRGNW